VILSKNLEGDGRRRVEPNPKIKHDGLAAVCGLGCARRVVNNFMECGHSTHSARATLMWIIQEYCHMNNIKYKTTFNEYGGYIERITS